MIKRQDETYSNPCLALLNSKGLKIISECHTCIWRGHDRHDENKKVILTFVLMKGVIMYTCMILASMIMLAAPINTARAQGSATNSTFPTPNDLPRQEKFKEFISKFHVLAYPFIANTACYQPDSTTSQPLDMGNDSLFINYVGPGVSVGLLPDTTNFYAVIYCTATVCYMPNLAVYSKKGKLISQVEIAKGCGSGEGYECMEVLTIKSLHDIVSIIKQDQYGLDSTGENIPGSQDETVDTSKYLIDNTGTINIFTSHVTRDYDKRKK